jgi:hypothetical protein
MKNKLVIFLLFAGLSTFLYGNEFTIVSEIEKLPNGDIPKIVVNPDYANNKVKEIQIYPFINGKAKVVMTLESASSSLGHSPLTKNGVIELLPSK